METRGHGRKKFVLAMAIGVCLSILAAWGGASVLKQWKVSGVCKKYSAECGIAISVKCDWEGLEQSDRIVELKEVEEVEALAKRAAQCIKAYPPGEWQKRISRIVLCQRFLLNGEWQSACEREGEILIAAGSDSRRFKESYSIGSIHGVFLQSLCRDIRFPREEWMECNGRDFFYDEDGRGTGMDGEERSQSLAEGGFLARSGTWDFEVDVNLYVLWLWEHRWEAEALSREFEKVARKFRILKSFYREVGVQWAWPWDQ